MLLQLSTRFDAVGLVFVTEFAILYALYSHTFSARINTEVALRRNIAGNLLFLETGTEVLLKRSAALAYLKQARPFMPSS